MSRTAPRFVPAPALTGSLRDHRVPKGDDLLARVEPFYRWQDLRRDHGLWPYCRATDAGPATVTSGQTDRGEKIKGVNFASQDYLSMSSNPVIKATAHEALEEYGVHSAGSPAFVGNTGHSVALEGKICDFLQMEHTLLFPTGWAAGFGAIKGLVRTSDHIVMDVLAHACLQEGASAATKNVYLHRHLDVEHARHWLSTIRAKDKENGILVVTEGLFSMDSDVPNIRAMQELCRDYNATLMVDVAHDLGALGDTGRGFLGVQKMLGEVDLVMGSFSKTFASNGGFISIRDRSVKEYLRYYATPGTFSNALSPMQAAVVGKAFDIIASEEGAQLRRELMTNVLSLRQQLTDAGFRVYGEPSAIVAVEMGTEALARLVARRLPELGLIANLCEFPAVPKGQARFRLQVMAKHTPQNLSDAVVRLKQAYEEAQAELEWINSPRQGDSRQVA
jgi:7-keto-8-aminopelargonate synthetase-like enzyme